MDRYRNKRVLIIGIGKTGFSLINFFNRLECSIRVTDIKPIFNLNKEVKKLKKIKPVPQFTFGEHREEDFLNADVVIYSSSVDPNLPQLKLAREHGIQVLSEFALANELCEVPIIVVCGSWGRTTVAHMIGYALKLDNKNVFVGGGDENPFINLYEDEDHKNKDYVVIEASVLQLRNLTNFHPHLAVYTDIDTIYPKASFNSYEEYLSTKFKVAAQLTAKDYLIVNFDKLSGYTFFRNQRAQTYWYSRKSFVKINVINEIQGTHFHEKRIHCNIHSHSEFKVSGMRIVGVKNRENLLASITACKALQVSDQSIQELIIKFPGIPHRLEYVTEKNGVRFYNDSKSESMDQLVEALASFKNSIILIAGGKEVTQDYEHYLDKLQNNIRVIVLVGESKEGMNRIFGNYTQTYLVGSFEESILIAYQKSRTGDVILLSPGNPSTDIFRDFRERGNYYKKLIFQF